MLNIPMSGQSQASTNPTFRQIKVTGPTPCVNLARQCVNARKDRANQVLVKLVVTTTLAMVLTSLLGISNVILLCTAVTLGEMIAYGISLKTSLPSYVVRGLLFVNSVALINPVLGLIISGFTFGVAEKQITEKRKRRFYKAVSVGIIFLAIVCMYAQNI